MVSAGELPLLLPVLFEGFHEKSRHSLVLLGIITYVDEGPLLFLSVVAAYAFLRCLEWRLMHFFKIEKQNKCY